MVHHVSLIILLAAFMLASGFFKFAWNPSNTKCFIFQVIRDLTEGLVNWSLILLAVYALSLHETEGLFYNMLRKPKLFHVSLVVPVWVVNVALVAAMYAEDNPFQDDACEALSTTPLIVRCSSDVLSYFMLLIVMVVILIRVKRCSRVVITEEQKNQGTFYMAGRNLMAGTITLICAAALVLYLPSHVARLFYLRSGHSGGYVLSLLVYIIYYFPHIMVFPFLLVRHHSLRNQLLKTIFHKCFVYKDETFFREMECRYSRVQSCRKIMSTPEGRMSMKKMREDFKRKSIELEKQSMEAASRKQSAQTGSRKQSGVEAGSRK
ncbi:hypothetical protein ACOMHN_029712 [Nucella lapillus]